MVEGRTNVAPQVRSSSKEMDQTLGCSLSVRFFLFNPPRLLITYRSLDCDSGRTQHVLDGTCGSSPAVVSGRHLLTVVTLRTQTWAVCMCTLADAPLTPWHLRATLQGNWKD